MTLIYVITIFIGCFLLIKSTDLIIRSIHYLAKYFHISEFVIAFILAGLATSLPELFIGIMSATENASVLSLSNIFGSNISNLTLILGLSVIVAKKLSSDSRMVNRNIIYVFILVIYAVLLALDGYISRIDGIGLIILFVLYNTILFFQSKEFEKKAGWARKKELFKNILMLLLGILFLVASAEMVVQASISLAEIIKSSIFLVGLILVALGTSLPEFIFGLRSFKNNHKHMILGGILGSIASNVTVVLGATAIISPILIQNTSLLLTSAFFMIASYILFAILTKTDKNLSRKEGFILILIYIIFIIIQPVI
ncbi:MAG TPA: sodium:calcium antiporter [Patescibacteria group bacterium]|nr:sodium:calcium antiporter [Patescibacteria group bacterium]